jgi:hypothetical protein
MTDAAESANGQPTAEQAALAAEVAARGGTAPPPVVRSTPADERPELAVGAAFAGGLALALVLKRLVR